MRLKGLERAWRRVWIAALTRLLARRRGQASDEPPWHARPHRVLFLRHDRIGDMIVSTGLLRAIARAHPERRLDVLASPTNAPVVRGDPHVAEVLTVNVRRPWRSLPLVRRLRAARYDVVVDCMPTAPSVTTLLLMLASGARERVGVAGRGNDAALTIAVPPRAGARHIIDHLSALAAPFGVDVERTDMSPAIALAPDEVERAHARWRSLAPGEPAAAESAAADPGAGGRRLLVNVSAGRSARRWPATYFVQVVQDARAHFPGLRVLVVGAAAERPRVSEIAALAGVTMAPTESLREALALVATADVVLTPDTGLAHAASAFRKPTVDLLLAGRADGWGLYGVPGYSLESSGETLATLHPSRVTAALLDVLRSLEPVVEATPAREPAPPAAGPRDRDAAPPAPTP